MAGQGVESCQAFLQEAALTDDFGAWMNGAQQALDNGLTGKARDAASRAQKHDPLDPHPLLLLAVCARQEKDDAEADRLVAAALRMRAAALPPDVLSQLLDKARGKQEV